MMSHRAGRNGIGPLMSGPSSFADLSEEVEAVLDSWENESYKDLIDKTEFLDSSRVKRND